VTPLEQLIELLAAPYRWGLHPFKLLAALLVPLLVVWAADRRLRRLADVIAEQESRKRKLPRTRRR
jgi:hypothetical protein